MLEQGTDHEWFGRSSYKCISTVHSKTIQGNLAPMTIVNLIRTGPSLIDLAIKFHYSASVNIDTLIITMFPANATLMVFL